MRINRKDDTLNINNTNTSILTKDSSTFNTSNSSNARVQIIDQSEVGKLDQNAFLNMLLTQLQNQDPMNPLDNTEFASQLAQYSTLEQLTSIGSKLDNITSLIVAQMGNSNTSNNTSNNTSGTNESSNSNSNNSNDSEGSESNKKNITFTTDFIYNNSDKNTSKINSLIKDILNNTYYHTRRN